MKVKEIGIGKSIILYVLVFISAFALIFSSSGIRSYAAGVYFEVDKNPIERVEIVSDGKTALRNGESVKLSSTVYPENARETVIYEEYKIIDGTAYGRIENGYLIVSEDAPVGAKIEVISEIDGVVSENSLVFSIAATPISGLEITNHETSIAVGGALKLTTAIYPDNATEKHITYCIVSDTSYMQVSYSGILSFNGAQIPDGELSVTVRAYSTEYPEIYDEKTFEIYRPMYETIEATAGLTEVNQKRAYSFSYEVPYLSEIFGNSAILYSLSVEQDVAIVDVNGLVYITDTAPIGTEIVLYMVSYNGNIRYEHHMTVAPVYATDFTTVNMTDPGIVLSGVEYYLPGDVLEFDVVSYSPGNVSEINKVFAVRVSDETLAYVDGNKVIIRDVSEIKVPNARFTVTVYSEPNGLEHTYDINVFIPVSSVTAYPKGIGLIENNVYPIADLVGYEIDPGNGTVYSLTYGITGVDESVATLKDGNVIIKDNLPSGTFTVGVYVKVNDVISNTVELDIYKPARTVELGAVVNGMPVSDNNIPVSSINGADKVILITKVNKEASANTTEITVSQGAEYIDGDVYLLHIDDGEAYFEFSLKKNLGSVEKFGRVIKLIATQDGVTSNEVTVEIYIPNEEITVSVVNTPNRGCDVELAPVAHTLNATYRTWEFELTEDAVALGVTKVGNTTIHLPKNLSAGTVVTFKYRSVNPYTGKADCNWKICYLEVAPASAQSKLVYEGKNLSEGFNVVYGTDSAGVTIAESKPQLWVGRYADITLKYIDDVISSYGMSVKAVIIEGPGYEDEGARTDNMIRVCMNKDALGKDSISITVIVSDGTSEYTFSAGTLYTFRPMSGALSFNTMTANGQSLLNLINRSSGTFDFDATYGVSDLKFSLLSPTDLEVSNAGVLNVKSYNASTSVTVKYTCVEYYNNKEQNSSLDTSVLNLKTVKISANNGSGGSSKIVAVSGMVGLGDASTLKSVAPTRSGYFLTGFDSYIDCNGKVVKDYSGVGTLTAQWIKIKSTVVLSADNGKRDKTITDADKYTETIYPGLDRNALKAYGYTTVTITITFDAKEINDGYQDLWIYSYTDQQIRSFTVEHGSGKKDTSWWSHTVTFTVSIDNLQSDGSFWIRWGAHGDFGDDWKLGYTTITVQANKK